MRNFNKCSDNSKPTKAIVLTFLRKELLYDVSNYAFVEADIISVKNEETEHVKHQVFDIGEDGNVDRATRILNLSYLQCVEVLYPYTKNIISDNEVPLNDKLQMPEKYEIILSLPCNFSKTTINLLEFLIHDFLVCSILADWMSITNPSSQDNWSNKAETLLRKIKTAILSRSNRVRRVLKPF